MRTVIRKVGNSAGMTIPAPLLNALGLSIGDALEINQNDGELIIKKIIAKPKYSLDELLKQCDAKAPMPSEISHWEKAENVGNEIW